MSKLAGVFAATVTPFDRQTGQVDHAWIRDHLRLLRGWGCDGVVPLGTNGEGPSLSLAERKAVIETVVDAAGGLAVVPGTGCANLPETAELTRFALAAGADSALVIPAFFFKNVPAEGVLAYYQRLCDQALQPGQQILLYHFPAMSAVPIAHAVVEGLQRSHPGCVAGIKDSSGDLASVRSWSAFPGFRVFAGSDTLASQAYGSGVAGTITAGANLVPDLIQEVRQAVLAGRSPEQAQSRLNLVREWLSRFAMGAATKYLVSRRGDLKPVAVRPPLVELTPTEERELTILVSQFPLD